jgi:hypothetical protein
MTRIILPGLLMCAAAFGSYGAFDVKESGGALAISEDGKPVLVYHFERVPQPAGVAESFGRSCYIHPLYGLDGEVLTDDFPSDHYHHRGVFWAWPECQAGDRRLDVWEMREAHQHYSKWIEKSGGADKAAVRVVNFWSFDDAPDKALVEEDVAFTVHPAKGDVRFIDFVFKMTNVSDKDVTFLGAKNKGYGGLCFRPAKPLPYTFTTDKGVCAQDALRFDTPWADISFKPAPGAKDAGVTIVQDPKNPGYPFPGWIFRHYGFLGASWPHEQTHLLKPKESFELRYSMCIHRGKFDIKMLAPGAP